MAGNYRCSNIKFNMDDPTQNSAYMYLQEQKGKQSYGKIVSEALAIMIEQKSGITNEVTGGKHIVPSFYFGVTEEGMERFAEILARSVVSDLRYLTWLKSTGAGNSQTVISDDVTASEHRETGVSEMLAEDTSSEDTDMGNEKISDEMLAFACG